MISSAIGGNSPYSCSPNKSLGEMLILYTGFFSENISIRIQPKDQISEAISASKKLIFSGGKYFINPFLSLKKYDFL